ncbi:MAG TPA: efflux RND transporter periplasmic adaptor subunit [Bdellovibrionota bacterium]|nr:efflux RND transporter periplasmic adaptor subunit [Bdellovibrionota bacterium]
MKKRVLIGIAVVVIALVLVKVVFFRQEFLFAGTLEATRVDLSARLASTIASVKVQEGEHVTEGEELLALDCEDIKIAAELAKENFVRNARLFKAGTVSQEAMDQVKNRKQDADIRLNWCVVRSPISGTVLSRYREPGEWVNPGTKLLSLADIRDIWAYIYVPQTEIAKLKPGMTLKGYLPESDNREFEGKIMKINEEAEFTPKNVQTRAERTRLVFGVKVGFRGSNAEEILKPGMTIEIKLPEN